MMGGLQAHLSIPWWVFLTKNSMTPVPHPPYSPHLASNNFFFVSPDEKSPERETAEALKGIGIDKFKNCFEQWKKVSIGVLHQMESTLRATEV